MSHHYHSTVNDRRHAMHLTVIRTQQLLPVKMICPPGLSRANHETARPPPPCTASDHQGPHSHAFSARNYHPMHLASSFVHPLPLSSNFNSMSSFLQENSCKEAHFHLLRWALEHLAAQGVPSPARKVKVPALWSYHA